MSRTLALAQALIARPSVTPDDAGCLSLVAERLGALGFVCERLDAGPSGATVSNLWAVRRAGAGQDPGSTSLLVFAGHVDVVPPGSVADWTSAPFAPTLRDGLLVGRGACDMKSSIAAMVVACEEFLASRSKPGLSIAVLLTSDEEGPAVDGTVHVCDVLRSRSETLDWCIVGEPTSVDRTGDVLKNGRRGSLSGRLVVKGVQGHIAYPHLARNPIHLVAPALAELAATEWDQGNAFFQPTSWQASNLHAGTGAGNVIPGTCVLDFNFRFSPESTPEALRARVAGVLDRHGLDYDVEWTVGALPFLTPPGRLVDDVRAAVRETLGVEPQLSTTGGTSDARFLSAICPEVVELGPPGGSAHRVDEHIALDELERLTAVYRRVLERLDDSLALRR
jgi:succinyl-diaminopimelate desuccinylase